MEIWSYGRSDNTSHAGASAADGGSNGGARMKQAPARAAAVKEGWMPHAEVLIRQPTRQYTPQQRYRIVRSAALHWREVALERSRHAAAVQHYRTASLRYELNRWRAEVSGRRQRRQQAQVAIAQYRFRQCQHALHVWRQHLQSDGVVTQRVIGWAIQRGHRSALRRALDRWRLHIRSRSLHSKLQAVAIGFDTARVWHTVFSAWRVVWRDHVSQLKKDEIALVHWSRHHIRQHLMVWRQQLPGWRQRRQTEQSHALSLQRHRTRAALRHWLGWSARHKLNTALMDVAVQQCTRSVALAAITAWRRALHRQRAQRQAVSTVYQLISNVTSRIVCRQVLREWRHGSQLMKQERDLMQRAAAAMPTMRQRWVIARWRNTTLHHRAAAWVEQRAARHTARVFTAWYHKWRSRHEWAKRVAGFWIWRDQRHVMSALRQWSRYVAQRRAYRILHQQGLDRRARLACLSAVHQWQHVTAQRKLYRHRTLLAWQLRRRQLLRFLFALMRTRTVLSWREAALNITSDRAVKRLVINRWTLYTLDRLRWWRQGNQARRFRYLHLLRHHLLCWAEQTLLEQSAYQDELHGYQVLAVVQPLFQYWRTRAVQRSLVRAQLDQAVQLDHRHTLQRWLRAWRIRRLQRVADRVVWRRALNHWASHKMSRVFHTWAAVASARAIARRATQQEVEQAAQVLARHQGRRTLARWRYALRCRQEEAELHRRAAVFWQSHRCAEVMHIWRHITQRQSTLKERQEQCQQQHMLYTLRDVLSHWRTRWAHQRLERYHTGRALRLWSTQLQTRAWARWLVYVEHRRARRRMEEELRQEGLRRLRREATRLWLVGALDQRQHRMATLQQHQGLRAQKTMLVVERAALHWKRVTLAHRLLLARSTAAVSNQSGSAGSTAVPAFTARDHILYHLSAAGRSAHHPSANSPGRTSSYHTAVPSAPLTGYQHALPPAAAVPLRDDQDDNIRLRADVSTRYAIPVTAPPASQPGRMMASVSSLNMPAASFNSYSYRSAPTDVLELLAEIDQLCSQRQQRLSAAGHPAAASSLSKPN